MNGRDRMAAAMRPGQELPDRVPVMCQLALGHYFLQTAHDPVDIWHDSGTFSQALLALQRRYRFDGILVNLPGRPAGWREFVRSVEWRSADGARVVRWRAGSATIVPPDDNPRVDRGSGSVQPIVSSLEEVDPERLFYVDPHDLGGPTYPYRWSFAERPAEPGPRFFPPWCWDTLKIVRAQAPETAVHGEVFSPFSQLMELVGYEETLAGLVLAPTRVAACLDRLADGAAVLACGHIEAGADAVLVSSAFAGAGFISRDHYRRFVLPAEQKLIDAVRRHTPRFPIYTHICGAIGDRLDLIAESGTDGIDTLDPPPLGTVDLEDAKQRLGATVFLKGNLDPVNTLLFGTPAACLAAARERIRVGKPGGGYILSSACSVAPRTPSENLALLFNAVEETGYYE